MSTEAVPVMQPSTESKSARKKKSKAEQAAASQDIAPEPSHAGSDVGAPKLNGVDGVHENQYIKEIQK